LRLDKNYFKTASNGELNYQTMKNQMKILFIALVLGTLAMFSGCNDDDDKNVDPYAPTVVSTIPTGNATGLARNEVIEFTFSELMNATTISNSTFLLKQGSTNVPGIVEFSGINGKFTPTQFLAPGTIYTAIITKAAEGLAGNAMQEDYEWSFTTGGSTATLTPIDLGASGNYVILAKTAINNSPTSVITGDAGISPAAESYMTGFALTADVGFATSEQVTGRIYAADMVDPTPLNLTTAIEDMNTAYNSAAGLTSPDFVELNAGDLGGKTLSPGVYKWTNTVLVPTTLTVSGSANDVWVMQIAGNLSVSSDVVLTLAGGAQAKNIFWQVAGEVTIGTGAHFEGIILSKTGITMATDAELNGRALAQTAVILDKNVVTQPQ
jgi:hypothetical protein